MGGPDTHDIDALAGAMYFIVGRGTEGGASSYRLSIAGITAKTWGNSAAVVANSGYSLGTIQVDLGQRGTWPLGATQSAPLQPGQTTYVDAVIEQAKQYAEAHHLKFASNLTELRMQLLSHGNGRRHHSTLAFIDANTRDAVNAWASSGEGEKWIHRYIDYPQVRSATQSALEILDAYGSNISEDHRLEALAILTKTANQLPSQLPELCQVLRDGGNYDDFLAKTRDIAVRHKGYDGLKAASVAGRYLLPFADTETAAAMERAQAKVARIDFDPSSAAKDPDLREALKNIGRPQSVHVLRQGYRGDEVSKVQRSLVALGFDDGHGRTLQVDGAFGRGTEAAVEAFQRTHGLKADGRVGPRTLDTLEKAIRQQGATLADRSHPGHPLFCQALEQIRLIDARCGRVPDELSSNLAGSLAMAAQGQGLARIDHVVLGENATRAFAVQGELDSPFRQFAGVDILQAVATPLAQSSAAFRASPQLADAQAPAVPPPQAVAPTVVQDVPR